MCLSLLFLFPSCLLPYLLMLFCLFVQLFIEFQIQFKLKSWVATAGPAYYVVGFLIMVFSFFLLSLTLQLIDVRVSLLYHVICHFLHVWWIPLMSQWKLCCPEIKVVTGTYQFWYSIRQFLQIQPLGYEMSLERILVLLPQSFSQLIICSDVSSTIQNLLHFLSFTLGQFRKGHWGMCPFWQLIKSHSAFEKWVA